MLILQRKVGEALVIGEDITVSVVSIDGNRVRLAISAPEDVSILRSELVKATAANQESASNEFVPGELLGLLGEVTLPVTQHPRLHPLSTAPETP